jgi:hypothetical protein
MSVELKWHPTLPVLVATYRGTLSGKEYDKMVEERAKLLKQGPDQVVFLADTRDLQSFTDAEIAARRESIFANPRVIHTLVILQDEVYRRFMPSFMKDAAKQFPVSFATDPDLALTGLTALLR